MVGELIIIDKVKFIFRKLINGFLLEISVCYMCLDTYRAGLKGIYFENNRW